MSDFLARASANHSLNGRSDYFDTSDEEAIPDSQENDDSSDEERPQSPLLSRSVYAPNNPMSVNFYIVTRHAPLFFYEIIVGDILACEFVQSIDEDPTDINYSPLLFYNFVRFELPLDEKTASLRAIQIINERKKQTPDLRIDLVNINDSNVEMDSRRVENPGQVRKIFQELKEIASRKGKAFRMRVHKRDMAMEMGATIMARLESLELVKSNLSFIAEGLVVLYEHFAMPNYFFLASFTRCNSLEDIPPFIDYVCKGLKPVVAKWFSDRFNGRHFVFKTLYSMCPVSVKFERIVVNPQYYPILQGLEDGACTMFKCSGSLEVAKKFMTDTVDQAFGWFLCGVQARWFVCDVRVVTDDPKHGSQYELITNKVSLALSEAISRATETQCNSRLVNMLSAWEGTRTQILYLVVEVDTPMTSSAMSECMVAVVADLNRQKLKYARVKREKVVVRFHTVERDVVQMGGTQSAKPTMLMAEGLVLRKDFDNAVAVRALQTKDKRYQIHSWADDKIGGLDWWSLPDDGATYPPHMGMFARSLMNRIMDLEHKNQKLSEQATHLSISLETEKTSSQEMSRKLIAMKGERHHERIEKQIRTEKEEKSKKVARMYNFAMQHMDSFLQDFSVDVLDREMAMCLEKLRPKLLESWIVAASNPAEYNETSTVFSEMFRCVYTYTVKNSHHIVKRQVVRGCFCFLHHFHDGLFKDMGNLFDLEETYNDEIQRISDVERGYKNGQCYVCCKMAEDARPVDGGSAADAQRLAKRVKI